MKRSLIVALFALTIAPAVQAITWRTSVVNDSVRDIWFAWGGIKLKTKRCYYHVKPRGDVFTTTHYTSDSITLRYYVCESGLPVQKEIEYKLRFTDSSLHAVDSGDGVELKEIENTKK